jgi:hypothetical protein
MFSGLSDGQRTCAAAVFIQALSTAFSAYPSHGLALSDATCKACGDARWCPVDRDTYSSLNPAFFRCLGGGVTDNDVTWCAIKPTGGFIVLVVILPLLGLAGGILACCCCCPGCPGYKRRRHAQQQEGVIVMSAQQPMMVAMNPLMVMGAPQQGVPVMRVVLPDPNAAAAATQQRRQDETKEEEQPAREAPAAAADAAV